MPLRVLNMEEFRIQVGIVLLETSVLSNKLAIINARDINIKFVLGLTLGLSNLAKIFDFFFF